MSSDGSKSQWCIEHHQWECASRRRDGTWCHNAPVKGRVYCPRHPLVNGKTAYAHDKGSDRAIIHDVEPVFTPHPWPWADRAPAYVYRCFDADMKPLYVGMTKGHPYERLSAHVVQVKWTSQVRHVDWSEFPNEATARHHEAAEIRRLEPPYNGDMGRCGCREHRGKGVRGLPALNAIPVAL